MCGSIWSCSSERVMDFSAFSVLSFCKNHHLLQAINYLDSILEQLSILYCVLLNHFHSSLCSYLAGHNGLLSRRDHNLMSKRYVEVISLLQDHIIHQNMSLVTRPCD